MLHQLRSEELCQCAPEPGALVSIGVPDLGYFDWIDTNMGKPEKHIGIEYYAPQPSLLPDNVTWLANTAGNMIDVSDESVGTIFAGQVIEHLWASELGNFILEASRVLQPGGRLIIDSPNEEIVTQTGWNHPEHTIELRPDDAAQLLELGGFTVTRLVGHWLCRSAGGTPFPLLVDASDPPETARDRCTEGRLYPQGSFSWWIEGRKERTSKTALLLQYIEELWSSYWPRRIRRQMYTMAPEHIVDERGEIVAVAPVGWSGLVAFGPCAPLPSGRSLIGFELENYSAPESPGYIEILQHEGVSLAQTALPSILPTREKLWLDIDLSKTTFGLEFRLISTGITRLAAKIRPDVILSRF
jgi:SAM-dependent methyltransferase